jgi:hypothetical protein
MDVSGHNHDPAYLHPRNEPQYPQERPMGYCYTKKERAILDDGVELNNSLKFGSSSNSKTGPNNIHITTRGIPISFFRKTLVLFTVLLIFCL